MERVPVGLYSFSLLDPDTDGERDRTVLVYKGNLAAFEGFANGLPSLLKNHASGKKDSLALSELVHLENQVRKRHFANADSFPPVRSPELQDMIQHTNVSGHVPEFVLFEERDKVDIDAVAKTLFEQSLGGQRKLDYLRHAWEESAADWQRFFGIEGFAQFVREVSYATTRLEMRAAARVGSRSIEHLPIDIERMSLGELREQFPDKYSKLRSQVDARQRSTDGVFECANTGCGFKSKDRGKFEMDHRHPFAEGDPTRLDNLQLLCVKCNVRKGRKSNDRRNDSHRASRPYYGFLFSDALTGMRGANA